MAPLNNSRTMPEKRHHCPPCGVALGKVQLRPFVLVFLSKRFYLFALLFSVYAFLPSGTFFYFLFILLVPPSLYSTYPLFLEPTYAYQQPSPPLSFVSLCACFLFSSTLTLGEKEQSVHKEDPIEGNCCHDQTSPLVSSEMRRSTIWVVANTI